MKLSGKILTLSAILLTAGTITLTGQVAGQKEILPSSIEIHWSAHCHVEVYDVQKLPFKGRESTLGLYDCSKEPYIVSSPDEIKLIYDVISKKDTTENILKDVGADPVVIKRDADNIWKMCSSFFKWDNYNKRFSMNRKQRKYFAESFSDAENLRRSVLFLLDGNSNYGEMNEYKVILHWPGGEKEEKLSGRDFYAHYLYPYVKDVWANVKYYHTPHGDTLYKRLHQVYMLEHNKKLHQLGRYDILKEIRKLKRSFEVVEAGQLMDFGYKGVYAKNDVPVYYALLSRKGIPENIEFKYIFEKRDGCFPSFDAVERDFDCMVESVLQAPFFQSLVQEGYKKLSVSYVNESTLSSYQTNRFYDYMKKFFDANPEYRNSLMNGKAIYVEAIKDLDNDHPARLIGDAYIAHGFLLFPDGKILVSEYGNRLIPKTDYRFDDKSTLIANSGAWIFMPPSYKKLGGTLINEE